MDPVVQRFVHLSARKTSALRRQGMTFPIAVDYFRSPTPPTMTSYRKPIPRAVLLAATRRLNDANLARVYVLLYGPESLKASGDRPRMRNWIVDHPRAVDVLQGFGVLKGEMSPSAVRSMG